MFRDNKESGQGFVEYSLILGLVLVVVVIVILALLGGTGDRKVVMPTDVCIGTVPSVSEQNMNGGKKNVIVDYVNNQGDTVHLLYGQDKYGSEFQMYSRDVDPGDGCKR